MSADHETLAAFVRSLHGSGVIGFNEDGSVWVFGGLAANGSLTYTYGGKEAVAPVWKKGKQYATADSPMAEALRKVLHNAHSDTTTNPQHFDGYPATD